MLSQDALLHKAQTLESVTGDKRYFRKKEYPGFDAPVFKPSKDFLYSQARQILNEKGTDKKVRCFLQVPTDSSKTCSLVVGAVNRWDKDRESYFTKRAYERSVGEVIIAKRLVGKEGIAQFLFSEEVLGEEDQRPKLFSFWKYYEGGSCVGLKDLSALEQIQIAKELIVGVWNMHILGIVHGDLKPNNALRYTVEGKKHALWTDFGNSFDGEIPPSYSTFWSTGYGSALSAAPEVWQEVPFRGDYFKADIFALGTTLFQLYTGRFPPWAPKVCEYLKKRCSREELKDHLITSLASFKQHVNPYLNLICMMLEVDPEKRIDIFRCKELISDIE
jgi:serine/threonine protein kinase